MLVLAILLTFFIGFSRYYLGMHTINQIFYGWQLGLLLAVFFHFGLREPILKHIAYIVRAKKEKLPYTRYLAFSTLLAGLSFGIQVATYLLIQMVIDQGQDEERYLANLLTQEDCAKYKGTNLLFNRKSIIICGLGVLAYGAYLGLLLQKRYFQQISPGMLKTGFYRYVLRLLVLCLIALPFGLAFLLMPNDANMTVSILFKTLTPGVLMMFSLFAFSDSIYA